MKKKEPRSAILYARVKPSTLKWLMAKKKEANYKSQSEFLDDHFCALMLKKKAPRVGKQA